MSQPSLRLFTDQPLKPDSEVALAPAQAHYLGRVMRREAGAPLLLFNGRDGEWSAELAKIIKSRAVAKLIEQTRPQKKSPDLWLLFAPVKRAPLDQIAQKATELGVLLMQPIKTARTIVTRVREDRLLANAIEAAEQCERLDVPEIRPFEKLAPLIENWRGKNPDRRIIFCDEAGDDAKKRWGGSAGLAPPMLEALGRFEFGAPWAILTGPEGGFSAQERDLLRGQDFVVPVRLGPRLLRADTAAFAAITLWQAVLGDFTNE